jgi:ribosome maturation factor RimP
VGEAHFFFSPHLKASAMAGPASRIESEITQLFEDEGIVLLEFSAKGHGSRLQIRAIADRRQGYVSIDDCVNLTRQIQHMIREKNLLESDYRLEVSSPGLDYPLREHWQFTKNIGRLLKISVAGEKGPKEISGRLTSADAEGIALSTEKTEWKPRYSELLSARVLPEFKPPRME